MRVRSHPLGPTSALMRARAAAQVEKQDQGYLRTDACPNFKAASRQDDQADGTARNHALRLGASGRGEVSPSGRVDSRYAKVLLNGG